MHVHGDGRLYIGGSLGTADNRINNVVAWDGTNMDNLEGGVDDLVEVFYTRHDGTLLVGGYCDTAGGQPAERLAVLDQGGWNQFGPGVPGLSVNGLMDYQGKLYVGGNFTKFYGHPADILIRWNGQDFEAVDNSALNSFPRRFLVDQSSGKLYMYGLFNSAGGRPGTASPN